MGVLLIIVGGFIGGFVLMGAFCILSKPVEKDVETNYIDECIKVMLAYKEGAKIEYMILDGSDGLTWREVSNPAWNWSIATYRVKKGKHINTRW